MEKKKVKEKGKSERKGRVGKEKVVRGKGVKVGKRIGRELDR